MSVKYTKFDSFLKRILPNEEYKEVRIYEPCIVTSSRDKHAFRFACLTNDTIYVTENPPKTLLYSVLLSDVVDVHMMNDKADFLQADLRDQVQHIIVKHISRNNDGSPDKANTGKSLGLSSPHHSFPATFPGSVENAPSSSKEIHSPLLCSYADVSTVESTQTASFGSLKDEGSVEEPFSPRLWGLIKSATAKKSKMAKPENGTRWEQKDPYPIQVILPESENGPPCSSTGELHLYILDKSTTFLPMLKSLWRNYIIHSTHRVADLEKITSIKSASIDEHTKTLFADLKQELLYVKNVEQLFGLYNELKMAASRDILIKSLFWRDDLLLKRSLELVKRHGIGSVSVDIDERADEIELTILVLHALALMLRETEAIPHCYRVLQNFSLPSFTETVNSLLTSPRLLCDSWFYHGDVKVLLTEFTIASCEVLYQLIICAQQITWVVSGKSSVFNSSCLFTAIDTNENLHTFLDRLVGACINIWVPHEKKSTKPNRQPTSGVMPFTPEDAVKAFYLFTVFHRVITKSLAAALHIKSSYQEEFKYYINPGSVKVKFPLEYPISGMARSTVHAVGYHVAGMTRMPI